MTDNNENNESDKNDDQNREKYGIKSGKDTVDTARKAVEDSCDESGDANE